MMRNGCGFEWAYDFISRVSHEIILLFYLNDLNQVILKRVTSTSMALVKRHLATCISILSATYRHNKVSSVRGLGAPTPETKRDQTNSDR